MSISQLVTYMKRVDGNNPEPENIMISTIDKGLHQVRINEEIIERRYLETMVFDQEPIETLQGPQRRTIDRSLGSSDNRDLHASVVDSYARKGYQVYNHQDFEKWDRMLEGIPGFKYIDSHWIWKEALEEIPDLDSFVKSDEEKVIEG